MSVGSTRSARGINRLGEAGTPIAALSADERFARRKKSQVRSVIFPVQNHGARER